MSIARVHTVKKSRKDQGKCGSCGDPLPAGSAYRYFQVGFRSRYYHVRCMKAECTPRPSQLESSKMADVYAAQESFEDALNGLGPEDAGDIEGLLDDFSSAVSDVAYEYREADEQFGGGGMTESGERADGLESAADEISNFSPSVDMEDVEPCEVHDDDWEPEDEAAEADLETVRAECEDCQTKRVDAFDELLEEVRQHVADIDWGG